MRGDYIGHFLDLGINGGYNFMTSHFTQNTTDIGTTRKVWNKSIDYINDIQYCAYARFGINRYGIVAKYRISDIFVSGYSSMKELPPLSLGIEIGIHK